jgi:hypothetical protein
MQAKRFAARIGLIAGAAAVASVAVPGAAAPASAACTPKNAISGSNYHVRICGLPDYDQRRMAVNDLGAAKYDFTGLGAKNGSCHCVPTSFMNVLGFYASKGISVQPKPFAWDARSFVLQDEPGVNGVTASSYNTSNYSAAEASAYEEATKVDAILGTSVKTTGGKCGTGFSSVVSSAGTLLIPALFTQGATFSFTYYGTNENTGKEMATAMSLGATVLIAYGRYPTANGVPLLGQRNGGHVMTLRGIKGGPDTAVVSLRDPANDEKSQSGKQDRVRQSPFLTTFGDLKETAGFFGGTVWQLDQLKADGTGRFVDGWMAIWPQLYLFVDNAGFSLTGQLFNFGGASSAQANAAALSPRRKRFNVGALADATFVPRTGEVVFVRKGSKNVEAINLATSARRTVGRGPSGIVDLETDARRGDVFVLGSKTLVRLGIYGKSRVEKSLPSGFDAIAYDALNDRVATVSSKGLSLRVFAGAGLGNRRIRSLPASLVSGSGRLNLAFNGIGQLLLRREGAVTVRRAGIGGSRVKARGPATSSKLKGASGFTATDRGTLGTTLSLVRGRLIELSSNGTVVPRSPFAAITGSGRLVSIIRQAADLSSTLAPLTVDQRVDANPDYPELATDAPPAGAGGLRVFSDDAADAQMDAS